jgi:hypothetical protein
MFILPSVEVRWFVRGSVDPAVRAWFESGERPPHSEPEREDRYLAHPDESLGIKLRQGKLEVKRRESILESLILPGVAGSVERWRKWSFALSDDDLPHDSWIAVHKRRRVRKYAIRNGRARAIAADDRPAQGCNVELTELTVNDDSWWTIGCEAFGDESSLGDHLLTVARVVFADEAPRLELHDSYGYPAWLVRLGRGG